MRHPCPAGRRSVRFQQQAVGQHAWGCWACFAASEQRLGRAERRFGQLHTAAARVTSRGALLSSWQAMGPATSHVPAARQHWKVAAGPPGWAAAAEGAAGSRTHCAWTSGQLRPYLTQVQLPAGPVLASHAPGPAQTVQVLKSHGEPVRTLATRWARYCAGQNRPDTAVATRRAHAASVCPGGTLSSQSSMATWRDTITS